MIPADIDPTLCSGEPNRDRLDDGFSAPAATAPADEHRETQAADPACALSAKSLF